ncbi:MAG: AmmeMemoRadiSam system protein B [Planctomycetes bacterium]|nr:AmmeMemoRadiSam system protein B [Planctomycetota bacterium]
MLQPTAMTARVRSAAVAGFFYPVDPDELRRTLTELMPARPRRRAAAALVPHAGYAYSGRVAAEVFSRVDVTRDVVLLAFHHRGIGAPFAVWGEGAWETPLGRSEIGTEVAARMKAAFPELAEDEAAFRGEHSAEVQVPFLQACRPDVRIVPVALNAWAGGSAGRQALSRFARALAECLRDELVVATTDLTHCGASYGMLPPAGTSPRDHARTQDGRVLERVAALDADGFWDIVVRSDVSMCGVAPTAVLLDYGRHRGAAAAEVVAYATSADEEAEADRAVGYAGVIVW